MAVFNSYISLDSEKPHKISGKMQSEESTKRRNYVLFVSLFGAERVKGMGRVYPKKPTGRPPKHGARTLARTMRENALDKRTRAYRLLQETANSLAEDAGGWGHLTNREKLLIRNLAAVSVITQTIENYAFSRDPIRKGALLDVLSKNYIAYSNTLRLGLLALNLTPPKPPKDVSLPEYLAQQQQKQPEGAPE